MDYENVDLSGYWPREQLKENGLDAPNVGAFASPFVLVPINRLWARHVSSALHTLLNSEIWSKDTLSSAVKELAEIIDCVQGGANCKRFVPVVEVPVEVPYTEIRERIQFVNGDSSQNENEESECDDMAGCGKCPDLRWSNGVLEMSYFDDCGCKKWRAIPTNGAPSGLNGALGSSLGGALLNEDGTPKEGGRLDLPEIDLGQRNFEITACSKATKLTDILITSIDALLEADSQIDNLGDALGLPLTEVFTALTGYLSTVAPTLAPALKMVTIAQYAKKLTEPIREELQAKLAEPNLRQTTICDLSKLMVRSADVTSEDFVAAIASLGLTSTTATFLGLLQQSWDLAKVSEILQIATNDIDCGCPELVQKEAGVANTAPELATWAFKADLKTNNLQHYGFTTQYGNYVSGKGLDGTYDNAKTRNYADVFIQLSAMTFIERVDVRLANVVKGIFVTYPETPDSEIEGFYMRTRFNYNVPIEVTPIKTPITTKTVGVKGERLDILFMFGYDETDPNIAPDNPGFGTIESVTVWGRGTIPASFDNWEQVYGA